MFGRSASARSFALIIGATALLTAGPGSPPAVQSTFAATIAHLSERGGYFDTDNLISNERSYLHVVPGLKALTPSGGAYIGVGPDQNFSYIAQVRPTSAFIVDVRRDNLLLHLLFKAIFARARNRAEYLCMLTGRPVPKEIDSWRDASLRRIVEYVDRTAAAPPESVRALRARLAEDVSRYGVPLTPADAATVDRFHRAFIDAGLSLQFQSHGRPPRSYYPSYRELLLETDREGHMWNFLASEADFEFVRDLERRDLVVPVVGDISGPHTMEAIAQMMTRRGERLTVFYVSNVEMYLFQNGSFARFIQNLQRLPHTRKAVVIRAIFNGFRSADFTPGYASASVLQPVDEATSAFSKGLYRSYWDLINQR